MRRSRHSRAVGLQQKWAVPSGESSNPPSACPGHPPRGPAAAFAWVLCNWLMGDVAAVSGCYRLFNDRYYACRVRRYPGALCILAVHILCMDSGSTGAEEVASLHGT